MAVIWHEAEELAKHLAFFRESRRRYTGRTPVVVATSGGFDCLHRGHVRCIQSAARLGECLVVIVNGDGFLHRKKGYAFMTLDERLEIVAALKGPDHVLAWDDGSQFVDGALSVLRPDIFAKGGDRSSAACMAGCELAVCNRIGCVVAYGVGGTQKVQSSSALCSRLSARDPNKESES